MEPFWVVVYPQRNHPLWDACGPAQNGCHSPQGLEFGPEIPSPDALLELQRKEARSLQPITVEGLVGMGFYKEPIEDTKNAYAHPCGLHFDARKKHQSMHILVRRPDPHDNWIDYANPQPQTMLDVDNLIERLSR